MLLHVQNEDECSARITVQREKQLELIVQLKSQLEDLETFAYETGSSELPTSRVMEKQNAIIDQLKHNLDLNLDNFDHLSLVNYVNFTRSKLTDFGFFFSKTVTFPRIAHEYL
jgi:hypothetical protein